MCFQLALNFFLGGLVFPTSGWIRGVQNKETKAESSKEEKINLWRKKKYYYYIRVHIMYKGNFVDLIFSCTHCEEHCQIITYKFLIF